ncbi:hypothetical protein [Pseudomonas soli]|uniref:hypothetical protein n=1 Tax=Pseudomonas soli TaxID=1306993 RepID=UPI0028A6F1E1|nr:hypothetical protein [Pseudomonas soli]
MKLLNTYEDKYDADEAAKKILGKYRVASERDSTVVIYNLFGDASWGNFFRLGMYNLKELKALLEFRQKWREQDKSFHKEIIRNLQIVGKNYDLRIPSHWN